MHAVPSLQPFLQSLPPPPPPTPHPTDPTHPNTKHQDSCFAFEKYISEEESLFGAMDGHGPHGHLVSSFVKQHLPILLVDYLTNGSTPQRALSEVFLEVDARLGASRIDCEFSGSTCVVAYLKVGGFVWGGGGI